MVQGWVALLCPLSFSICIFSIERSCTVYTNSEYTRVVTVSMSAQANCTIVFCTKDTTANWCLPFFASCERKRKLRSCQILSLITDEVTKHSEIVRNT